MLRPGVFGPGLPEAWAQPTHPDCSHLGDVVEVTPPGEVCPACAINGDGWARQCLVCGRVGCCNASPNRHAHAHFEQTGHTVMRSIEPGETWRYCWLDEVEV